MKKTLLLCITTSIYLTCFSQTKKGNTNLSKTNNSQSNGISSSEFNKLHSKDFFSISTKTDTLELSYKYKAFIVIDSTKIKDLNKIKVLFYDKTPLERKKNKFKLVYMPFLEGFNSYDITIINNSSKQPDTIKSTISFYALRSSRPSNIDYIALADKMPKFNSAGYTSFNDYLIKSFQKENIKIKGKVIIDYTVMTNGSTRFEQIQQSALNSYEDEEKIEKIISKYKGWTVGEDKGRKVNVYVSDIFKF
jgi:hypothetical protein